MLVLGIGEVSAPRVAVFGSANMDLVVNVERAPRKGETVVGTAFRTVPGGKGANQALAAARAGGDVCFLGAIGVDEYGAEIRTLLESEGIDVAGLVTVPGPTGTAHIVVDAAGANSIVVVAGANGTVQSLTDSQRSTIAAADVLLLQLELPLPAVGEAAAFAHEHGVRTVLTPAPARPLPASLLADTDLLVPNEHEAAALSGIGDPSAAAHALLGDGRDVLVTLGAAGARYVVQDQEPVTAPAFAVDAVDTTAAGDCFVGAFAVAYVESGDLRAALRVASAAAALTVQRFGASASMPRRAEINRFLAEH